MKDGDKLKLFGADCYLFDFYYINNRAHIQLHGDKNFFLELVERSKFLKNKFNHYLQFIAKTSEQVEIKNLITTLNTEIDVFGTGFYKDRRTSFSDVEEKGFEDFVFEHVNTEINITLIYYENYEEKYDDYEFNIKRLDSEKDNDEYIQFFKNIIYKTKLIDKIYKELLDKHISHHSIY